MWWGLIRRQGWFEDLEWGMMNKNEVVWVTVLTAVFFASGSTISWAEDLHVDPGSAVGGGNGSLGRPYSSIDEALEAVRGLGDVEAVEIILHGGDYELTESVVIDVGGLPALRMSAWGDEVARLVGGLVVGSDALELVADAGVLARLPSDAARAGVRRLDLRALNGGNELVGLSGPVHRGMGSPVVAVGSEVFWDGQALTRSRWPNAGFVQLGKVVDAGSVPRNRADDVAVEKRETGPARGGVFVMGDEAVKARMARWVDAAGELNDAWAVGYWHWDWADEQLPIESVDGATGEVRLGLPHRYGLRDGGKFYVTNLLAELDVPGEYCVDGDAGVLYVWPPSGKEEGSLVLSLLAEPMMQVKGAEGKVVIEGITFAGTRGAGLVVTAGAEVEVLNCVFENIGTNGIVMSGERNVVRGNSLRAIGATGVSVTGGDRATLTAAGNVVAGNHIRDFGRVYRTYQPGVRLAGVGQQVTNNEIHDAPHSGLIFYGNDHVIARNEFYDVLKETGDCGAIYAGRDWTLHGTVIKNNFFHDLEGTEGRYQNAVYLDDMASGITVTGNVFLDCHWGMLVGGGRDNLIQGNVFVGGSRALSFDARGVGWMAGQIADPSTSTLHKNYAAVPIEGEIWRARFPSLVDYLTDRFGRPAGSAFVGNGIFNTKLGWVADRECVLVEGNFVGELVVNDWFAVGADGKPRFRYAELMVDEIAGFEMIPVRVIGLQ